MTADVPPQGPRGAQGQAASGEFPPLPRSPLDESHFLMVRRAKRARVVVQRAARTAAWDAGITLTIGLLGLLLCVAWWSWLGMLVTAGISVIGVVGLLAWTRLKDAEPGAARVLALNQLAFMALIVFYCGIQMLSASPEAATSALLTPELMSQLRDMPGMDQAMLTEIARSGPALLYGFYSLVILLSVLAQGGMALYYVSRRRHLETYRRETPEWVRRLLAETGG